ncbi:MAG: hypothetical protein AB7R90_19755 [Reyranellaceae bacterium]
MSEDGLKYRRNALLADYLRAGLGAALTGVPMLFVAGSPATLAILGGLTGLFLLFGLRTLVRHLMVVSLGPERVRVHGGLGGEIPWRELDQLKLGYYTTRRDRQGGWMQLSLRGGGRRLKFDSSLEGFDRLVRQSVRAAAANDLPLSDSTLTNLASMDIPAPAGARRALG